MRENQFIGPAPPRKTEKLNRRGFILASSCVVGSALARNLFARAAQKLDGGIGAEAAARAVLERLLGVRARDWSVASMPLQGGLEAYEISASNGQVRIKGTSGVAICRGAYTYLRENCGSMVTWSGQNLDLSSAFPDLAPKTTLCPYKFVQYYNPCSFGYTTAFWSWERWKRELDWMALHGVTMALAMEGQESIWQRIWLAKGLSQEEVNHHFTGPGHLPWHRMGNIDNFEGPLPQSWIEQKRELQKKILNRMRELGIHPIVPGFSGFVPQGFKRIAPQAKTYTELWSPAIPRESKTFILDPDETELYKDIGGAFIREYRKEFGASHHYLVDTFNELAVPVRATHRSEDLARFAETVYNGIKAGDPEGVWVMQGWLFRNDPKFWDKASISAFFQDVPDDRIIILDYSNDSNAGDKNAAQDPTAHNIWQKNDAFFGKQWINGMLHTFGGNNNVKGNLALIAAQPPFVLASSNHRNLAGWSINPEGIETNEVVYELMTDIGWTASEINLTDWIQKYCKSRYGSFPPEMSDAWDLLRKSAYSSHAWHSHHSWQTRPSLEPKVLNVDSGPIFMQAVAAFISCADQLKSHELYRNDLIELVSQAVGGHVDRRLLEACEAHKAGKSEVRDRKAAESLAMLLRVDALMNIRSDRRLETWTGAARSWGQTPSLKDYYDQNARRLITYWGSQPLNDYASRVWSGLIRDYYVGRWSLFFRALKEEREPFFDVWEETWLSTPYAPTPPLHIGDVVLEARQMLKECEGWS